MRYFRNNREQAVIREDDNGKRFYRVFDTKGHCASEEIPAKQGDKIA